jgi:two-component system, cell cycle sensor histidine kinase and response regulator CckA
LSNIDADKRGLGRRAGSGGQAVNVAVAGFLAVLLAVTAAAFAYSARDFADAWLLFLLGAFAFVGLAAIMGGVAGYVQVGRRARGEPLPAEVIEATREACAVTDRYGRVIYASPRYLDLADADPSRRTLGVEHLYAGYPDIADHIYRLAQAAREGASATEEFRLVAGSAAAGAHRDRTAWLKLTVEPFTASGRDKQTLWRIIDLTEERAEQEVAFQKLQHIIDYLDHAPAGFFSADENGRIQYLNATLAGWLGIDLAQTTGGALGLTDIVSGGGAQLIESVRPVPDGARVETFDIDLLSADGRPVPVRILHRVSFGGDGMAGASRSLVLNRSPGADVSETLRAAEVRFARFFNYAPIGIAIIGRDGLIKNANAMFARATGETAVRGKALNDLVGQENRDALREVMEAAWADQAGMPPVDLKFQVEGGERSGRFFVSRIEDDGEDALIVYAVDTTEQRSLELQFAQSQKMQAVGQLAGGVAHDFNNVLTAIIGFSDLLLARHRPTDPSFQDIMNIKQNANRAANLVRQLLAFSRRQTLRPEVISLTDVLADLGNLLGRLLGEKIELKTVHGRDLGLIKVDLNQFEQVIINLAVNARDAMPDGGTLTVRTANVSEEESRKVGQKVMPAGEYVLCEVSDTGSGMTRDVLEKIYEPFFSTKEVGKGTGLGLSTVYGIVKQTGGFIFAESEVDKGTVFRIYLPRYYRTEGAAEEAAPAARPDASLADTTGHGTILLVEDEEAVRAFASRALASRGYTVLEAGTGEEALVQLNAHPGEIDLVISDVVMPEMDGPTLLKELRKTSPDMKVIFISGYAEDAFKKNLDDNEKFSFLPKPFSLKQLAAAVKETMTE